MAIFKRKGSKLWTCMVRTPGGKQIWKTFPTKAEAEAYEADAQSKKYRGDFVEPSGVTFGEYAERLFKKSGMKPSTLRAHRTNLEKHILPALGDIKIQALGKRMIKSFLENLRKEKGLAFKTTKNIKSQISSILESAVDDNLLSDNPAIAIKIPAVTRDHTVSLDEKENIDALEETQADLFIETCLEIFPPTVASRALLICYCVQGLRRNEALALTWGDVKSELNKKSPVLRVRKNWDQKAGFITPKTYSGRRELPLFPDFLLALREWYLACPNKNARSRIFPYHPDGIDKPIRRVTLAANLPHVSPQILRRTFATIHAFRNEIPPKKLQHWMGHSDIKTTFQLYARHYREGLVPLPGGFGHRISEKRAIANH